MVADLPMPEARNLARSAIFSRALETTLWPSQIYLDTFTDIKRPFCWRITARRVGCEYQFTTRFEGITIYREDGTVSVSHRRQRVRPFRNVNYRPDPYQSPSGTRTTPNRSKSA
jgi:hypothetical protein